MLTSQDVPNRGKAPPRIADHQVAVFFRRTSIVSRVRYEAGTVGVIDKSDLDALKASGAVDDYDPAKVGEPTVEGKAAAEESDKTPHIQTHDVETAPFKDPAPAIEKKDKAEAEKAMANRAADVRSAKGKADLRVG